MSTLVESEEQGILSGLKEELLGVKKELGLLKKVV